MNGSRSSVARVRALFVELIGAPNAAIEAYRTGMNAQYGLQLEPLSLATVTCCVKTTLDKIPYEKILSNVARGKSLTRLIVKKEFRNSATFGHLSRVDGGEKGLKIGSNGTLHITGVKCGDDMSDILSQALMAINEVRVPNDVKPQYVEALVKSDIRLHMANFYAQFNMEINLEQLRATMLARFKDISFLFDKDQHPGLRFKIKLTSLIVFRTGKTLISGTDASSIFEAYQTVLDTLLSMSNEKFISDSNDLKAMMDELMTESDIDEDTLQPKAWVEYKPDIHLCDSDAE
jgi:TATA-box binding protein (TBP) (component of TFIID and TFIIIB)